MVQPGERSAAAPIAVILMGVSGCGKSTLGASLAEELGCPFLEGDSFHTAHAIAKMTAGRPLTDEDRWPWLDRLGGALGDAVRAGGLAVAACSALKRSYRERLIAAVGAPTRFVFLDDDRASLARRLRDRPDHYMPASLLDSQLDTLERPGPDEPAITLDAGQPPEALCRETLAWIGHRIAAA